MAVVVLTIELRLKVCVWFKLEKWLEWFRGRPWRANELNVREVVEVVPWSALLSSKSTSILECVEISKVPLGKWSEWFHDGRW